MRRPDTIMFPTLYYMATVSVAAATGTKLLLSHTHVWTPHRCRMSGMVGRRRASRTSMKRSSSARPGSGASAVTTSGASTASSGCSMASSKMRAYHTSDVVNPSQVS